MFSSSPTARFPTLPLDKVEEATVSQADEALSRPAELSDELLLARLCAHDCEALGILFRRYAALVRSIGKRILRNDAEAEDLVQEVFLYFFRRASVFDSRKGPARSCIVQYIYYRAINQRRYLSSRHQLYGTATKPAEDSQARAADRRNSEAAIFDAALLQEILKSLTSEQFETVRLFFFEGYTLAEISEKLGQSLGNVPRTLRLKFGPPQETAALNLSREKYSLPRSAIHFKVVLGGFHEPNDGIRGLHASCLSEERSHLFSSDAASLKRGGSRTSPCFCEFDIGSERHLDGEDSSPHFTWAARCDKRDHLWHRC
jgi:RNA polymerase sigma-70 factor, ECF subfamily